MSYKIGVVGLGYVGLTVSTVLANSNMVFGIDVDERMIQRLNNHETIIYEPGLFEMLKRNKENIYFDNSIDNIPDELDALIICVGTPPNKDGSCDLSQLYSAVNQVSDTLSDKTILIIKSTVPVGTTRKVQERLAESGKKNKVLFVPEFLSQSTALQNAITPSRVIIGGEDEPSINFAKEIFAKNSVCLVTSWESAEMIKYASNAFLATKISFINEVSTLCQATSANIDDVANGMGLDNRIGKEFLKAGIGFGGSCLGKDLEGLISIAQSVNVEMEILKSVKSVNKKQKTRIIDLAEKELGKLKNVKCSVLGLSFKPNTDDVRDSPALTIVKVLREKGALLKIYDPMAGINFVKEYKLLYGEEIHELLMEDIDDALNESNICFILTEWDEIKSLDKEKILRLMKSPIIVDGRNCMLLRGNKDIKLICIGK